MTDRDDAVRRRYRRLARVLPRAFREARGREMEDAAVACLARERARRGRAGAALAWMGIVVDLLRSAAALRRPSGSPPGPQRLWSYAIRDARHGWRALRRQPVFTATAVITLALGLGANTAVFTVVESVLRRPLPYPEPDRLVFITSEFGDQGLSRFPLSLPELAELRQMSRALGAIGGYTVGAVNLGTEVPARTPRAVITPDLLAVLGVPPLLGRTFTDEDARPGAPPVAILSHALWQRTFGGDAAIVGRPIAVNDVPTEIVGVMPPGFDIRDAGVDLLEPLTIDPASFATSRAEHYLYLIGRLAPGVSPKQADEDLARIMAAWPALAPGQHVPEGRHHAVNEVGLQADVTRHVSTALWLLQGAVVVVLLVACANLAGLLLVRADGRMREYAMRFALGASRGRIFCQLLVEAAIICGLGAAAGLALAAAALPAVLHGFPTPLPRAAEIAVDVPVLLVALGAAALTSLVVAGVPFVRLRRVTATQASRAHTAGGAGLRAWIVAGETALAVTLVVAAGLLLRTTWNLAAVNPGFEPRGLTTFSVVLPSASYPPEARRRFFEDLRARLQVLPGVQSAATMTGLPPLRNPNVTDTDFEHIPNDRPHGEPPIENVDFYQTVSVDYLRTMGIRVAEGRAFEPADAEGAPVALVNRTLASRFFPDRPAVGGRVRPPWNGGRMPWFTIVGVVDDSRQAGLAEAPGTELYLLADQVARVGGPVSTQAYFALRSSRTAAALAPEVRAAVRELDRGLPVVGLRSMDAVIDTTIAQPRLIALVLVLFAAIALALAAVGTYGVLAFLVTERTREFGIRMTLGADRGQVMALVFGRGLRVLGLGLAVGLLASLGTGRLTSRFLFGVAPADPWTLAAVAAVVLSAGLVASIVPAWRATRVDPAVTLRE